ncbi:MAG: hypothetical protein R6V44_04115 [Paracoccaceae bacterium]
MSTVFSGNAGAAAADRAAELRRLSDVHETAHASSGLPVDTSSDAVATLRMALAERSSLTRR